MLKCYKQRRKAKSFVLIAEDQGIVYLTFMI